MLNCRRSVQKLRVGSPWLAVSSLAPLPDSRQPGVDGQLKKDPAEREAQVIRSRDRVNGQVEYQINQSINE